MPEHFPSAEEFLFAFDKHVTSFNLFNDCIYHVIVKVVCSSVMQKVFCKFTATNFAFNMVSMVVEPFWEVPCMGRRRPVRTCPFDLITLHLYFISSWLFTLLYVTCVMVNKAVKKKNIKKKG